MNSNRGRLLIITPSLAYQHTPLLFFDETFATLHFSKEHYLVEKLSFRDARYLNETQVFENVIFLVFFFQNYPVYKNH